MPQNRTKSGHFIGSGNPGGKPCMSEEQKAFLKAAADRALEVIDKIAQKGKSEKTKLAAAMYLIDRQYGKAVQPIGNDYTGKLVVEWTKE